VSEGHRRKVHDRKIQKTKMKNWLNRGTGGRERKMRDLQPAAPGYGLSTGGMENSVKLRSDGSHQIEKRQGKRKPERTRLEGACGICIVEGGKPVQRGGVFSTKGQC